MSHLTILNTAIRQFDNLYSLNDLHRVGGNEDKHRPTFFIRLDTTQELVAEIQKEDPNTPAVVRKNGIGTYACMEIALAYAMWIDPKFHLIVLRAYMAMKNDELQNTQPNLPLAEPEKTYSFEFTEQEIEYQLKLWHRMHLTLELLNQLEKPLEMLQSNLVGDIRAYKENFRIPFDLAVPALKRLTEQFKVKNANRFNWHTPLKELARHKPKGLSAIIKQ